jgi:hypothetical protein
MKPFSVALSILALFATLAPTPANAQQTGPVASPPHISNAYRSSFFDLHPQLTEEEFAEFAAELGSVLRFRQMGDASTLRRGHVDVSVEFAPAAIDEGTGAWNNTMSRPTADHNLGRSLSFPRVIGRFGVSDRVDVGAWGGLNPRANYGLAGADAKILLIRQGPTRPVSFSIRPSVTTLIGPSEIWAANAGIDLTVSRAFGAVSPYVGVATTASLAVERSNEVDLDPVTAEGSLAYAGLAYRWRTLVVSGEVENGTRVRYALRVGTRF